MRIVKWSKRTLSIILSILLIISIVSVEGELEAASLDITSGISYTIANGEATITGYSPPVEFGGSLKIPSTLGGVPVTSIGENAFDTCLNLSSVEIPFGVMSIGAHAFYMCTKLTNITIPNSVTTIAGRAFEYCVSLASVTLPGSVESIGNATFISCHNLSSIYVDASNLSYKSLDGFLYSKDGKTLVTCPEGKTGSVSIPTEVTSIGSFAFIYCSNLESITIPEGVTSIGEEAFGGCTGLTSITIPEGVTSISDFTFASCYKLSNVSIPNTVTNIGTGAFCWCQNITNLTIPSNVTTIAGRAFEFCSKLTSFIIPESVTSIGASSFRACTGLTNIIIPNNVTSIGGSAFWECSGLSSIVLSSNITKIENNTFGYCENLSNVTIPNSVTSIGEYAFNGCRSLTNITIPNNMVNIGFFSFYNCTGLTNLAIPDSVSNIEEGAFYGCSNLVSAQFFGNAPTVGINIFARCSPNFKIYYLADRTGFTSPIWNGYQSFANGGIIDASNTLSDSTSVSVFVVDRETNAQISGATVSLDGKSQVSDKQYGAVFSNILDGTKNLSVYYSGYNTFSCRYNISLTARSFVVYLEPTSGMGPKISSAIMTKNGYQYDIRNTQQTFLKTDSPSDGEKCSIEINVNWNGYSPQKVYLSQSSGKYLVSTDGKFTDIDIENTFDGGNNPISVYAESSDGTRSKLFETKIKVQEITSGSYSPVTGKNNFNMTLLKNMGWTIPDDMPVVGGTQINFGLDAFPASYEIDGNKMKLIIGIQAEVDENGKFKTVSFESYKEDFLNAARKQDRTLAQYKSDYLKSNLAKNPPKLFCMDNVTPSVEVMGYAEMEYENDQWHFLEGGLKLDVKATYEYNGQTFVGVFPICYSIGGSVGTILEGELINLTPDSGAENQINGNLTVKLSLDAYGGVGISKVASVGVKGNANLNIMTSLTKDYQKVNLDGSASFVVILFGGVAAEKKIAKGNWLIYETGNPYGAIPASSTNQLMTVNNLYSLINPDTLLSFENRSYADLPSTWLGGQTSSGDMFLPRNLGPDGSSDIVFLSYHSNEPILEDVNSTNSLYSFAATEYTNKTISILQTNIYPDAAPAVSIMDGKKVMVWLADNTTRSAANKTMLVYSVYDEGTSTWSAPKALLDDGMADYSPTIANGFVTWQKASQVFDDSTVTIADIAISTEIYVSKWNGTGFDTPAQITSNTVVDAQPQIAVNGSTATVVWTSNTNADILGTTGVNQIMISTFDGTVWSAPTVVADNLQAITNISAYQKDSSLSIAFVPDSDNNLNTIDDRDIYLITDGTTSQITNNAVIDSNPIFAEINGVTNLFWYNGGNINYQPLAGGSISTVFASVQEGLSDQFSVVTNSLEKAAVLWTRTSEDTSEIQGALFDGTTWSEDIAVSNVGAYAKYPSGILNDDGSLLIGFNNTAKIADGDFFIEGTADLCTLFVVPSYNLSVSDVSYDEAALVPSADMPISVNVTNKGELEISSLTATVMNGDATENNVMTISEALKPGETKTVTVNYKVPATPVHQTISVTIVPEGQTDANASDNTVSQEIGFADINILNTQLYTPGAFATGYVTVNNESYITATNVIVELRADSVDGEVLSTINVGALNQYTNSNISFDIDPTLLSYVGGINQIYVVATCDNEQNIGNNDNYLIISQPTFSVTFDAKEGTAGAGTDYLQSVGQDNPAERPANDPTRTGYSFAGWFADTTCTIPWNFDTDLVTSDATLYAKYTPNPYVVTFDSTGGSTMSTVAVDYNSKITFPTAPTKTGYIFIGWYRDASYMQTWYFDADVVTADTTLYAKWQMISVAYQTHVQDIGWQDYVSNGAVSGTSGQSKRLEAIRIKINGISGGIEYRTHVQDIGWQGWVANGVLSGTEGAGKRLEAIQIRLTGDAATLYDVYYRVHAQEFGWMGWAKNGAQAGTAGYSYRLEAIEIKLVAKGGAAPGSTAAPYKENTSPPPVVVATVSYKTHVEDIGWQDYVSNGEMSGTSAQSKRLEAIQIKLENMSGGIEYSTHVQDIGWMGFVANDALSGTSGKSKRLEAIKIRLTGAAAAAYDIYYCVHAQEFGWLDWAKNGEMAGTAGFSYRLEAIKIVLVPKGGAAPGPTARAFVQG